MSWRECCSQSNSTRPRCHFSKLREQKAALESFLGTHVLLWLFVFFFKSFMSNAKAHNSAVWATNLHSKSPPASTRVESWKSWLSLSMTWLVCFNCHCQQGNVAPSCTLLLSSQKSIKDFRYDWWFYIRNCPISSLLVLPKKRCSDFNGLFFVTNWADHQSDWAADFFAWEPVIVLPAS